MTFGLCFDALDGILTTTRKEVRAHPNWLACSPSISTVYPGGIVKSPQTSAAELMVAAEQMDHAYIQRARAALGTPY